MKVSFILLAHEKPEQLKDLLCSLLSAGSNVYVHHDATAKGDLPAAIAEWGTDQLPGKVFFAKRVKVVWGEWSIVQATLNCMEAIQQHDVDSDYFMLLSGSCMPVKPVHLLEQFLAQSGKDHIEAVNAEKYTWVTAGLQKQRWSKFHFFNWRYQPFLFDKALKIQRKLKIKRTLPLKHTAHMGSQWWCLRRSTLEKVWSLYHNKPVLKQFYSRTWVPDELFFQTMVANLVPSAERSDRLMTRYTFNSWGIPRVYYNDDYAELLGENRFFVRKVSHRAVDLRSKLSHIAPMQIDEFERLLESSEWVRQHIKESSLQKKHIALNHWHSLVGSLENPYDYIKSIPNPMVVLIGSDREAKSYALTELDRLDDTIVYGDLFDTQRVGSGYENTEGLIGDESSVALMHHRWHFQLGDIAYNHPGKTLVFSLGQNALDFLDVLRWNADCHIVMVDRKGPVVIDNDLMADLYMKSKVLHLLEDRHCDLSRVSAFLVKELVDIVEQQHWGIRAFNRMLKYHQTRIRWPNLLKNEHYHYDFLNAVYSKVLVFIYEDPVFLQGIENYLNSVFGVPVYYNPLSVVSADDSTLDWHYYLADLAHLNARMNAGVLAIAMNRSSVKYLNTLRWKQNLLVIVLEDEQAQLQSEAEVTLSVFGKKNNQSGTNEDVFHELDVMMRQRACSYVTLPPFSQHLIKNEINGFLQYVPL